MKTWDGCYVKLASLYRQQERYTEAEEIIQQGFNEFSRSARLLEEYCLLLYEQDLDIKEHESFLAYAEVFKNLNKYWPLLVQSLDEQHHEQLATDFLKVLAKLGSTDGTVYRMIAQRLIDEKEIIKVLRQGIENAPTDGAIYIIALARNLEDDTEVIEVLRKGIENSIRSPRIYLMLAERLEALQTQEANEEVKSILQSGVDLNIPDSRLYIQLARRVGENEPDESNKILEQGIQAIHKYGNPEFQLITSSITEIESLLSDWDVIESNTDLGDELQSEQEFFVDLEKTDMESTTSVLKTQMIKLFEDSDLESLMKLLEQQLYLSNNFHLALLYWEMGNRETAEEYLKIALEECE